MSRILDLRTSIDLVKLLVFATARLALLERFRNAVHQVADFSKIEG